jgi:nonribosomal peptide synthetase protein BlmX
VEESALTGFRTSPQQRHLWQRAGWAQLIVGLRGPVHLGHLARSVRAVGARHEALRTRVRSIAGSTAPVQYIDGEIAGVIVERDLSSETEPAAALRSLAELATQDCRSGIGIIVCRLADDDLALVLTAPALLADLRSLRVIVGEVLAMNSGHELAPVSVQYADFAAWHNDLLDDPTRAPRRQCWDDHLAEAPAARTAALLPDEAAGPGGWRTHRIWLGAELSAQVDAFTAAEADTAAVIATAWAGVLWRLAGEHDIAVVVSVPGRAFADLDAAVGPYARDAPIACGFSAEDAFADAVAVMAGRLREAIDHADDLDPSRLTLEPAPLGFEYLDDAEFPGDGPVPVTWVEERSRARVPAVLRAGRGTSGLWLELNHDPGRVGPDLSDEWLDRVVSLLRDGLRSPRTSMAGLSLLRDGERARLLAAGRGPASAVPAQATWTGMFRQQADRQPERVAVQYGQFQLSYAELDARSDRTAACLAAAGVGPGGRVVLWQRRSPEFLVSLIGVLKAGAAYVPVDVRAPWARVELLLADVGASALVVDAEPHQPSHAQWPPSAGVAVLCAEPAESDQADTDATAGPDLGRPDGLAYVMYTSGSSGVPNGVGVTHRNLLNYLLWAAPTYELETGSGALVHSSVGFDLTVTALLGPLLVGQRVVIVPEEGGLGALVDAIGSMNDISLLKLTPSHLDALSQLIAPAELGTRVRTLVLGGEQLLAESLSALRSSAPGVRIVNEYGPTETVVGSTAYRVDAGTAQVGPVPIGRPIAGTEIYLLDLAGQPVPDGVPGEIHIGGVSVTGGYLGRTDQTAQRFVDNPFTAGGRLYRTGDRGYRRPDGDLVYVGRLDDQFKVRGYRVEPAEVEGVLRAHPAVAAAAVLAVEDRLIACLVAAAAQALPTADALHAYCRQRLPEYLVPSAFHEVASVPVTVNGKVDRAALARLTLTSVVRPYVAPRSEVEEILAGAIGSVLSRDRVSVDDNYFVIGGDSIRSVMIASRAQARGLDITVADLHQHPTIRELALALGTGRTATSGPSVAPFGLISAEDRALMPAGVEDAFPLNLLQEGMIFHRAFAAKSAVYHAIASIRLRAQLDLDVLRRVIGELVRRHPMLRTSFDQTTFSRPLQIVHSEFADPLSFEDLRGLSQDEQRARIDSRVEREKQRGFELDEHPLIRFIVHRLDDESFQFTYGFHHEIVDGWSEALMVTELFGHYFSLVFDEPIEIRPPTASMRDAVALEIEALQQEENYRFWSNYLSGATLMRLPRPDGGPRADDGSREIVRITVPVEPALSDRLKALALANSVPLKSILLAAHMAVMNLYGGQVDTLTYTVTNGRPETADGSTAIGLFVNSLALRVQLSGGTWNDLILNTLNSERESLPYRRLPMAELKRHQGNEPLAETLFFFTDYHVFRELDRWRHKGVEHVASELYGESTFPFCAIFRLNRDNSDLEIRIEYDSLQFPASLMDSVRDGYVGVLNAMVADPDAPYHTRPLIRDAERRLVLEEWGVGTPSPSTSDTRVHDLIAQVARDTPDRVALSFGGSGVTYAELIRRAADVAEILQGYGAGPEVTVGLLAGRCPEAVVCMLGILMSGAAYLPLDPGYPDERLQAVLDDARPVAVLAEPAQVDRARGVPTLAIEPGARLSGTRPGPRSAPAATGAGNVAYVMYTSGSTGAPKGVVVTHAALVSSTLARDRFYDQPPTRFLLLSSLIFDSSLVGLFWPLCRGGTVVLPPEGTQLDPLEAARQVSDHRATHLLCVPSLLTALMDTGDPDRLASLQVVIAAGEACSREVYEQTRRLLPDVTFVNEYGPTENTVWSTAFGGVPPERRPQVPIGRPVAGVRLAVLNAHLQPVPVGVAGELCVGGAGLARGYLARPGLTASSFRPDPHAPRPGARMYRTGDLVRYSSAGDLEFLGRMDTQVKIRGFRVELGEIEGVLETYPGVRRSVVVVREDGSGDRMLVAYVAARPGTELAGTDLQRYVRGRLPKYMVPSTCVVIDAFPLTPTGKVDRDSLPAPERIAPSPASPAQGETEEVLAAIWCQTLSLETVGRDDDFFEIGGESLRAMQVMAKVTKVFGLELSVRCLYDSPTLAAMADAIEKALAGGGGRDQ